MKKEKSRVTFVQFQTALREQIVHARGMNVPVNSVSSAASFALLVMERLFGRKDIGLELQKEYHDIVRAAVVERAREAQAAQEENERRSRRVILPHEDIRHKGNN